METELPNASFSEPSSGKILTCFSHKSSLRINMYTEPEFLPLTLSASAPTIA